MNDTSLTTTTEVIALAGKNCYSTIRNLFESVGYNTILTTIGDHEIGGNPWSLNEQEKLDNLDV